MALGSLALYLAAFFFPELHRKQDFLWSGVGLFYALILWLCAGQMTGALLLGQLASVSLIMALAWQTLWWRRHRTPQPLQTTISADSLARLQQLFMQPLTSWSQRLGLEQWLQALPWPRVAPNPDTTVAVAESGADSSPEAPPRSTRPAPRRANHYEFIDEARHPWPDQPPSSPSITTTLPEPRPPERRAAASARQPRPKPKHPTPLRPAPKPSAAEPSAATAARGTSNTRAQPSWLGRLGIIKDWLLEVSQGLLRPKPKRTMIELPPRPRSIPRPADSPQQTPGPAPATPGDGTETAAAEASSEGVKNDGSKGTLAGAQDPEGQEN